MHKTITHSTVEVKQKHCNTLPSVLIQKLYSNKTLFLLLLLLFLYKNNNLANSAQGKEEIEGMREEELRASSPLRWGQRSLHTGQLHSALSNLLMTSGQSCPALGLWLDFIPIVGIQAFSHLPSKSNQKHLSPVWIGTCATLTLEVADSVFHCHITIHVPLTQ